VTVSRQTIAAIVSALALAGCGGGGGGGGAGGGGKADDPEPFEPEKALNHYLCYRVNAEFEPPQSTIRLADQLTQPAAVVDVGARLSLCNPARKGRSPEAPHPAAHLVCYFIKGPSANTRVEISNQFNPNTKGPQKVEVGEPVKLCVPSGKTGNVRPSKLPPIPEDVDHFKCYVAFTDVRMRLFKVFVTDQFFSDQVTVVGNSELCIPADKTVDGKPRGSRKEPRAHLACFTVRAKSETEGALIVNQFEPEKIISVFEPLHLCLPSTKKVIRRPKPPGE
jgi:hypothetical protein